METNRFTSMFFERLQTTYLQWKERKEISEKELYLFLHNIKGTSGTIGLFEIERIADEKLLELEIDSDKTWTYAMWNQFLKELFIQEEQNNNIELTQKSDWKITNEVRNELVLMIDNDYDFITQTKTILEEDGYSVALAVTGSKGLSQFYELKPNVVMIDVQLPDIDGFDILPQIVEKAKIEHIPIIVTSLENQEEYYIKSYNLGACDFLPKPINREVFRALVNNRSNKRNEIQQSIILDELTGAFNKKFLDMEIERQMYEFSRSNFPFSLAIVDLDCFKAVNDEYGHLVGDEVLKKFVDIVTYTKRASDIIMRVGGEEFVILLPKTRLGQAKSVLNRFLEEFSSYKFKPGDGKQFNVTFSAGVVQITEGLKSKDTLLKYSEEALFMAKEKGRESIIAYDENFNLIRSKKKLRLIVVDDDKIMRDVIVKQLSNLQLGNYSLEVTTYSDGFQFLKSDWYQPNEKYIILLDGVMPKMDGMEVLNKIRKSFSVNNILILMITARRGEKEIISALEQGADDFMTKPFKIGELVARISRLKSRIWV